MERFHLDDLEPPSPIKEKIGFIAWLRYQKMLLLTRLKENKSVDKGFKRLIEELRKRP